MTLKSAGIFRVLIVDDSKISRMVLMDEVHELGHDVDTAENGEQALAMVNREKYDIVLSDIEMPVMGGLDLLRQLRLDGHLERLMVIMISAVTQNNLVAQCIEAGAEDYLFKPIKPVLLRARLRLCAERKIRHDMETLYLQQAEILNQQLIESNDQLLDLNREKNEFLGIAAHDLKNPITAILGNVSLYNMNPSGFSQQELGEMMATIEKSCDRMRNIIVNLLDINRIETGNMSLSSSEVDLRALVFDTYKGYLLAAVEKKIDLRLVQEEDGPITVIADAQAVMQVLDNLVSNALKYSPAGKPVTISLRHNETRARFSVADQGPGLSAEDQRKLFEKFARLSPRPTGGEHSTGLGLSIVKRLVELMQGKVWCESVVGEGSRFIFELPKHRAEPVKKILH